MNRQYHPALPEIGELAELLSFWPSYESLWPRMQDVDRICLDRLLLIRERLLDLGLSGCSILDLGGGSGYFAWALHLTVAGCVDLVEDERARQFGYNDASFTAELRSRIDRFGLEDLHVHDSSIETFLAEKAPDRSWDVTICLSVLHHFVTGYGDNRSVGRMSYDELLEVFRNIGRVTTQRLFLEVDPERILNYEQFLSDVMEEGEFADMGVLGKSHSSIGVARNIMEFRKK